MVAAAVEVRMAELQIYTQRELAERSGVKVDVISDLINGNHWPQLRNRKWLEKKGLDWPEGKLAELAMQAMRELRLEDLIERREELPGA